MIGEERPTGYRRRTRRVVYENPWLRFEAHEMVHPNGRPGEHGVVVPPVASAVVACDGDDVILTRQARFAIDRVVLEVIKGGAHDGESPLACAQRELREEVGFTAQTWTPLGPAYEVPSIVAVPVWLFLAGDLTPAPTALEDVESIEAVRMPFEAALAALAEGTIADAITAVALVRAARRYAGGAVWAFQRCSG